MMRIKYAIACILLLTGTASLVAADPIAWPSAQGGNDHLYEYINSPGIDWETARSDAFASRWLGMVGHLATLTGQAEQDFVLTNLSPPDNAWIGGEFSNNGWRWVSYYEPWGPYLSWCSGEPDIIPPVWAKTALLSTGCWIDRDRFEAAPGYIVEFEADWVVSVEDRTWANIKNLYR